MILCLDVGNSQLFGGVYIGDELKLKFRYDSKQNSSSDQLGVFLKTVLRENNIDYKSINHIAICSVVPQWDYSLRSACKKYFAIDPFILQAGVKTGLKIKYRNPLEVGADRIANAIGATHHYPNTNILVVDFGTATTLCAISAAKEYWGGVILPGIRLSMEALQSNTAKLLSVEIVAPKSTLGRTTTESIQSGLFYGHLGAVKEIVKRSAKEVFADASVVVLGTGGFAHLFAREQIFTTIHPDLVLEGLCLALQMNRKIEEIKPSTQTLLDPDPDI